MKLTKENVYIDLRGKSKEELTDLYNFLESVGEKTFRDYIEWFLEYPYLEGDFAHLSYICEHDNWGNAKTENKQEVTIEQLKEILQPIDTLQQQLEKAKAEVKRLQSLIEEENNIKIGDWVKRAHNGIKNGIEIFKADDTHDYRYINSEKRVYQKITNTELIKLLEQEIK